LNHGEDSGNHPQRGISFTQGYELEINYGITGIDMREVRSSMWLTIFGGKNMKNGLFGI
jgi:hypothetical protein